MQEQATSVQRLPWSRDESLVNAEPRAAMGLLMPYWIFLEGDMMKG